MDSSIFNQLRDNAILDTGNDIEVVGFTSKVGSYEISFYAELKDDHIIIIDGVRMYEKWKVGATRTDH